MILDEYEIEELNGTIDRLNEDERYTRDERLFILIQYLQDTFDSKIVFKLYNDASRYINKSTQEVR